MNKKNKKYIIAGAIILALFVASLAYSNYYKNQPGELDKFVQCVGEKGAKFYGAFWCPHCQAQKALFGKSKDLLPYVECSNAGGNGQTEICATEKIESYPTWEFKTATGTEKITGERTLSDLVAKTGCSLPEGYKEDAKSEHKDEKPSVQIENVEISTSSVK
jgi:transcription elongation factor Elf1